MPGAAGALANEEPRQILKLDEDVVNRIAAGEVVQRPANAVKELMENSLDAGSTSITVTAKQGGLKLLQIQDNGHGIRREDLPIVCERFTTSKLREFGDLRNMSTFGFRGEALASITHTAKVTITSKTPSSQVAYKAKYSDGRLVPGGPGQSADPRPCAGITGTTILAEDLFYNMDTRRRAFKSPGEQYKGILDVVTRYAVHFGDKGVSFTCKKHGTPSPDLHTPLKSSSLANIRVAFGPSLSRELVELRCSEAEELLDKPPAAGQGGEEEEDFEAGLPKFAFRAKGLVSGPNYSAKRSDFILFINDRLVESTAIKKAVETAYRDVLPKSTHPFVYLGITMPSRHLDVNVHPTKREVHFLHQERLLACLQKAVEQKLEGANQSRTFYSQVILPDMNFGTPDMAPQPAGAVKKPGDIRDASPDTEDASPPDSGGGGGSGSGEASSNVTPARSSSRRPSPLAPRNVGVEAMAEGGDDRSDHDGEEEEEEEEEGSAGSSSSGRKRTGSGRKRGRREAGLDLGSLASSSSGDKGGGARDSSSSRRGGREASPPPSRSSNSSKKKKSGQGDGSGGGGASGSSVGAPAKYAPQKLVRTDRTAGNLDAFLRPSQQPALFSSFELSASQAAGGGSGSGRKRSGKAFEDGGGGGRGLSSGTGRKEGGGGGGGAGSGRRNRGRRNAEFELGGDGEGEEAAAAGDDPVVTEVLSSSDEEGGRDMAEEEEEDEDEAEDASMCVCPEDQQRGDGQEGENEEEEEEEQENRGGIFPQATSAEEGNGEGPSPSASGASAGGGGDASTAPTADAHRDSQQGETQPGSGSGLGQGKRSNNPNKKAKMPSRPFAGISRRGGGMKNCDCCGGRVPRGPDGSIVLTAPHDGGGGRRRSPGGTVNDSPSPPSSETVPSSDRHQAAMRAQQQHKRPESFVETSVKYHSVRSLIADFKAQAHKGLTQMLKKYSFVGMVDVHLSLLQFNTKLILVNHTALSKEAFFQMTLRRFGTMPRLPLTTPLAVLPLVRAALDLPEAGWTQTDGDKDDLAQDAAKLLEEKSALLDEYFMVKLSRENAAATVGGGSSGGGKAAGTSGSADSVAERAGGEEGQAALCISSLPLLLEGHSPVGEGLPMFLLRLAMEVDWTEERTCFEGVATELSLFYSTLPEGGEETAITPPALPPSPRSSSSSSATTTPSSPQASANKAPNAAATAAAGKGGRKGKSSARKGPAAGAGAGAAGAGRKEEFALAPAEATAVVQHILYPAFRWALLPPQAFAADGTVLQLACLERLYKVFERC